MPVSTGNPTLDEVLNGGLPEGRTVLATGTPGTGKSTLAMQFLQSGLEDGDRCLYISTEQTLPEIRDAFSPFDFDLEHDGLAITSLHLRSGSGTEDFEGSNVSRNYGGSDNDGDGGGMVMRTLEGGKKLDAHDVKFSGENLRNYLRRGAKEVDRVVVDSVTGLRPIADDDVIYRRAVLDLIQLFNGELDATALFTAESGGAVGGDGVESLAADDAVQFNVHGVLRLWRERMRGDYRRFIDVMKMRGVDHDTRRFEITFDDSGIRIVPRNRAQSSDFIDSDYLPTRIEGLDEMLGGGLLKGQSVLLEHDGQASIESFIYAVAANALDQRMSLAIIPRVDTPPNYLEQLFDRLGSSMDSMLENDQLFIVDALGSWADRENVIPVEADTIQEDIGSIHERARGEGTLFLANTEALVHTLDPNAARELRYWMQSHFVGQDDLLLDVHNPAVMDDELAAFYTDAATQVVETWLTEYGLQYVQLRKGQGGELGSMRVLEYIDDAPFVRTVK